MYVKFTKGEGMVSILMSEVVRYHTLTGSQPIVHLELRGGKKESILYASKENAQKAIEDIEHGLVHKIAIVDISPINYYSKT